MTWNEQVDSMVNVWSEAQKNMWESWYNLIRTAPTSVTSYTGMMDQWRKLAEQSIDAWTAEAEPVSRRVSYQLLSSQSTMMRFLDLTSRAWKAIMPHVQDGQDWQSIMNEYSEQLRKQLTPDASMFLRASQDVTELWTLYLQELQALSRPWLSSLQRSPLHIGEAITGSGSGSELIEMTNLYWDAFERTFGRLLNSPSVGFSREINETVARAFDAWLDFRRTSYEYQGVLAGAWTSVFEEVMLNLVERSERDNPITSVRDLIRLWTDTADNSLEKIFRSEEYVDVQGRLMDTAMSYRIREQQLVELTMKTGYVPTRSEVDEAHRNIYELRKEVRALKKALKAGEVTNGAKSSVADLRKEINALKKALKEVQESNGKSPAPAESGD